MSFRTNKTQQISLMDSFERLSPRVQKLIKNSWANDFAEIVFPASNEERFSVLYSSKDASRPNTPVNFTVGAYNLGKLFRYCQRSRGSCAPIQAMA